MLWISKFLSCFNSNFSSFLLDGYQIGNWSRWLTDLFGIDDDDSLDEVNGHDDDDERQDTSFKSFHLLNALSDLLMLPKDMLLSRSIRKEVQLRPFYQSLFAFSDLITLYSPYYTFTFEGMSHIWYAVDQEDSGQFCPRRILP